MTPSEELPTAVARRPRGARWAWFVPLVALAAVAWIGWRTWAETGPRIVVRFAEGHGLAAGAEVRYRGIAVGRVRSVGLSDDGEAVVARLDLGEEGERFAREGARFWVVRPQIDLESGVRGAETLLGSRYVAALPGAGEERHDFDGLDEPLLVPEARAGDLEIVLEAAERGNLDVGTSVTYRDVKVGVVLEVALAPDARSIEARVHVPREFAPLVRERTAFHFAGGVDAEWGTRFLFLEFGGQLARVLSGGAVALAVPPDPGPPVASGHRFTIRAAPEEEWSEWRPSIPLGPGPEAREGDLPSPVAARLTWKAGIFGREKSASGWVLPLAAGLLGPLELLRAPEDADEGSARLTVGGEPVPLSLPPRVCGDGVGLLETTYGGPRASVRLHELAEPVDLLALRGDGEPALSIAARHQRRAGLGLVVDPEVRGEGTWDGAVVVTRAEGAFVGVLRGAGRRGLRVVVPELSPSRPKENSELSAKKADASHP
ncbi:MAG: MlaD family protein [Planctomycetota bacterium JB042]